MDQLRGRSLFTLISQLTSRAFTSTLQEVLLADMQSRFSDGEWNRELLIGWWLTLGMKIGEIKVSSRSFVERIIVVSKDRSSLDCPNKSRDLTQTSCRHKQV